jgi:hypothetical protein
MSTHHGAVILASNASGTGAQTAQRWRGGKGLFMAEDSAYAGTSQLQAQSPQGTWIDVPSVSLTANGMVEFDLPAGQIRLNHTTSGATALYAWAISITT